MQHIINSRDIIKQLAKNGLRIGDKQTLIYHIKNFNYNTFIHGYSDPFYPDNQNGRYDKDANSDEIINLYKFDRDLANHILRFILVIEKIINTNVAYEVINTFGIKDKCLLKLNRQTIQCDIIPNLGDVEPKTTYDLFIRKLIKYLPTSSATKWYCSKNAHDEIIRWRECPLDVMCLTWSFSTSFSFFIASNQCVREAILRNFELGAEYFYGFVDFLKNTLHLRNFISHNNVIYKMEVVYQTPAFLKLYELIFKKQVNSVNLLGMIELIEHFSHSTTLVSNTRYYFNKLKIQNKFKRKIGLFEVKDND